VFWKVAPALVVGVFCFAIGSECSSSALEAQHAAEIQAAIESQASSHENIVRVKDTKYRTLHEQFEAQSGELDGARDQNGQLLSEKSVQAALISELRGEVTQLRMVAVDVRVAPGTEVVREINVEVPPPDFADLVRWPNDTPVAEVSMTSGVLHARSCELDLRLREALGDSDSSFLLLASSGCEEEPVVREMEISKVETSSLDPEKQKFWSPRLGLGFLAGATGTPEPLAGAAVYVTLLHPHKNVALLGPQLGVGTHLSGGVNIVGYNIGAPLPLVDDLWVHVGAGGGVAIPDLQSPSWHAWLTVGTDL